MIMFDDEDGKEWILLVIGGNVKLQWKLDFGVCWVVFGVDFEMYGKDYSININIYDWILEIFGVKKLNYMVYELFFDVNGEKIFKFKGNGILIDEWLIYVLIELLLYFMFLKFKIVKWLYFDVIFKMVDEYYQQLCVYLMQDLKG